MAGKQQRAVDGKLHDIEHEHAIGRRKVGRAVLSANNAIAVRTAWIAASGMSATIRRARILDNVHVRNP